MAELSRNVEQAYGLARERYATLGVDTEQAIERLTQVAISIHCWQGDDVGGFVGRRQDIGGGLAVTGSYPGKARTPDELRADFEQALALIPGRHRFNLHACYAEMPSDAPMTGVPVDRDSIGPELFQNWMDWARDRKIGLDFNPTFFAHPLADSGLTLAHPDRSVRQFWIEHGIRCRQIGAAIGQSQGQTCLTNVWIPDGMKDTPADRKAPRERLLESLDTLFAQPIDPQFNLDSVEPKLFGIGSESYVVGSHEFYLAYALSRQKLLCLDAGHYHPTESIADKISSVLLYLPKIALHVSRGVRWDSDHVVTLTDEVLAIAQELVWGGFLHRTHLGLDYFDASINRVAAWVIGSRGLLKALLIALLTPIEPLRGAEAERDFTSRLALQEEFKTLPYAAVWDHYCLRLGVPVGEGWLPVVRRYERTVLAERH